MNTHILAVATVFCLKVGVLAIDLANTLHTRIHKSYLFLGFGHAANLELLLGEVLLDNLRQRYIFLILRIKTFLHLIAEFYALLSHLVFDVAAYLHLILATFAEPEVDGGQSLVDHAAHLLLMAEDILQIDIIDAGIDGLQEILHVARLHALSNLLQTFIAHRAHFIPYGFGIFELTAYLK